MSRWLASRAWRWPAAGIAVVVVATLLASYLIARTPGDLLGSDIVSSTPASAPGAQVSYTLAEGRTASQVGADLQGLGVIRSARQFELLVSLMGVQDRLSAGDYTLKKDSPTAFVVDELTVKESVPVERVTFPEGIRVEEMAVIAEKAGFGTAQQFLDAVTNAVPPSDIAAMVPAQGTVPGYRLQGFLFPDTYILPSGSTDAQLVDLMLQTFSERYSQSLRDEASAQGITPYQALTMASIIEREAVLPSERPLIAGVFYNRLTAHDLIGADATVQFAVALDPASVAKYGYWKKDLTLDDLANKSPYNTRLLPGLPPGPIANPGLASIEAAANPTKTDYYFFVANAKKDDGSHVFAVTQDQQDQNIAQYGAP
ncbi:MAG: endolytic transglycosylase MltG [Tepidiformaceae bacterium]